MGGWKSSGFGVELGPEGMQAFTRQRVVVTARTPSTECHRRSTVTTILRGGTVVDGTGEAARRADVLIEGERVVAIGPDLGASADVVFDATDMMVTPGFIDLHTHYDAQLFWDPNASPSPLHGVTTVIGRELRLHAGPVRTRRRRLHLADDGPGRGDAPRRLAEGTPLGLVFVWPVARWTARTALPSMPDSWSATRRCVGWSWGTASVGVKGLARGTDGHGGGPPCRPWRRGTRVLHLAGPHPQRRRRAARAIPRRSRRELELLAAAVRDHEGTTVELIVAGCLNGFSDEEIDLLTTISLLADRPVNWNVLGVSAMNPDGGVESAGGGQCGSPAGGHRGGSDSAAHDADPPEL